MMKSTGRRAPWSLVLMSVIVLFDTACTSPSMEFMKAEVYDTQSSYKRFLEQYPSGEYSDKAKMRIAQIVRQEEKKALQKAEQEDFILALLRREDEGALRHHLTTYPRGPFSSEVSAVLADKERERQAEQDAFKAVNRRRTVEAYEEFLNNWPNSSHEQEVRQRLTAIPDYAEWRKVDATNVESLQAYLSKYPVGPHTKSARALVTMNQRLAAFRSKTAESQLTITAEQLGRRWEESRKSKTYEENLIGLAFLNPALSSAMEELLGLGGGMKGFRPLGLGHDAMPYGMGHVLLPAQGGQILAINTHGLNRGDVLDGFQFMTPASSPDGLAYQPGLRGRFGPVVPLMGLEGVVFFGVIEDVGLVHIYGKATVISPDGTVTHLVEPEDNEP